MTRKLKVQILNPMLKTVDVPQTDESAAFDLRACIDEPITIYPNRKPVRIPFGIAIEGKNTKENPCVFLMFIRSSLGVKYGITLANSVGVIDSDYRGEIMAGIVNLGDEPYTINPLDRIAQLAIFPIDKPDIFITSHLSNTLRGTGGFGSTGKN